MENLFVFDTIQGIFAILQNAVISISVFIVTIGLIVFSIPIFLFRIIVILLAKWLRPDLGSMMDACSTLLAYDLFVKRPSRCNTVVPLTFSGKVTRAELLKVIQKNWIEAVNDKDGSLKYPEFKNCASYWLGFLFWKQETSFNLENHVLSYTKPEGQGDADVVTEKDLNNLVETLLNSQFSQNRSPWELHVVENYQNQNLSSSDKPNLSVVVMRLHHSLADGYSLMDALIGGMLETDMEKLTIPKPPNRKQTTLVKKLITILSGFLTGVFEIPTIINGFSNQYEQWLIPDSKKKWHQRYAKCELIELDKVKHVKNVLGVDFTSVIVSAISAGVNKVLERKQEDATFLKDNEYMMCFKALPLPETEATKKKRLKNNVTGFVFRMPINKFPTSVDRLSKCHEILMASKNSASPTLNVAYATFFGSMTWSLGCILGLNRYVSTGISIFPAKQKTDKWGQLNGKDIVLTEFMSGALGGHGGITITIISFYPYIRISMVAESAVFSKNELNYLAKYIEEEVRELCSAAESVKPYLSNS